MCMDIPEEVLQKTTRCEHGFSCLTKGECDGCKVERVLTENMLMLSMNGHIQCPYSMCFGYGFICTCPTHYALHADMGSEVITSTAR